MTQFEKIQIMSLLKIGEAGVQRAGEVAEETRREAERLDEIIQHAFSDVNCDGEFEQEFAIVKFRMRNMIGALREMARVMIEECKYYEKELQREKPVKGRLKK